MTRQESLVGRVVELAKLIGYQDGAVVSRTVADKKAGTITVFAFDAGHGLSEHSAPFDAFVYAIDGEAEISISGQKNRVIEGQMIIMPANEPHAIRAVTPFKMLLVMIRA
ncbi:cupin domain-containing protein [Dehalogenimonas etheniformans]|uniref:Cupin domain-containing protein n=1 Tax=Dehalogenimonas etheniformans TaxID=1536648 RepID=A0A2P5P5N4_9CHLR|nr:cupin domain-containing protein [Dehalogenimonas etheniformans]PPD57606.1 cupin domain-containing protein [Dehalogenimonas etheniformans]QNT75946.1 cupin domain-containing protein [Dehalogenimonas etheniformans]